MPVPSPPTPTLGRDEELRLLIESAGASALTTVVGPGGVGKTRLSVVAAGQLGEQFRHGVHVAWLGDVRDPGLLLAEVCAAVGQPRSGGTGVDGLIDWLRERELLLLLDNAEHLLGAVSDLVSALMAELPALRILVTSREPLLISGETVFALHPLAVPSDGARTATIAASPAVQMFIDRMRARDRDFAPDDDACARIATVCRRLDGLPLAVELAAARAATLGLPRLVERLLGTTPVALSAGRGAPARHANLRAVFEWSEALLDDPERTLLRRLSVFAGGFTIADMDGVFDLSDSAAGARTDLDEPLAALVDKSLVQRDGDADRYALLETIREFAAERLVDAGEADVYHDRHARWFLNLAAQVGAGVSAGPERPWLERLAPEQDNVRVALRRAIEGPEPVTALAAAAGLPLFWWARGQHREGFGWLSDALQRAPDAPAELRAAALFGMAFLWAHDTDDWNAAAVHMDRAINELTGTPPILGYLLCLRGEVHAYNGAHDDAIDSTRRGLEILEDVDDPWGLAFAVWNVGFALQSAGRLDEAREHYTRMASIQAEHGSRLELMIAWNSLGALAESAGDFHAARELYLRALEMRHDLGATRLGYVHGSLPQSLVAIARCEFALGDTTGARQRLEHARPLAREMRDTETEQQCAELAGRWDGPVAGEFIREGDGWLVRYGSETGHVANSKGMRHLSILLARPRVPVSALTLAGLVDGNPVADSDAGPLLDDTALRAYRLRLAALLAESDAADAAGDPARGAEADRERSAVLAELSRATGLGGRARRAGSTAERARLNATRTIRDAITRIGEQCPELAAHLQSALHTGHRCAYEPGTAITWHTGAS